MIVCKCPFCQANMEDDGSLAGQVVACPFCKKQFQMPPLQPPAAGVAHPPPAPPPREAYPAVQRPVRVQVPGGSDAPHVHISPSREAPYAQKSSRQNKANPAPWVLVGVVVFGFVAAGIALFATGTIQVSPEEQTRERQGRKDRGVLVKGQSGRNFSITP